MSAINHDPPEDNKESNLVPPKSQVAQSLEFKASVRFDLPLPPPEILAAYKKVIPNIPERLLTMLEEEQKHAFELNRQEQAEQHLKELRAHTRALRGQIFSFALILIAIVAGAIVCGYGYWFGTLIAGVPVGVVGVFVLGKESSGKGTNQSGNTESIGTTPDTPTIEK